jgi:hypothetical protein
MSSANKDNWTFCSPIWVSFLSLSCLIVLRFPILCWIRVVKVDNLSLQILEKWFWLFSIQYDVGCGFVICSIYCFEIGLWYLVWGGFHHESQLGFPGCFFGIYWGNRMVWSFLLLYDLLYVHTSAYSEPSLHF